MSELDATVLICTWNRAEFLRSTLQSLAALPVDHALRWEVLVVDNNSTDHSRDTVLSFIEKYPVPLRYVFEERQGKSCAMNAGLSMSTAPLVVFTDDDVRVPPSWLRAACQPFLENSHIAYTGGPVRPMWETAPPEWFEASGNVLWGPLAVLDYGSEPFIFEERHRVPLGVNFAVRRSLVETIGPFNVSLGRGAGSVLLGQELPEFLSRARAVGAMGLYVPGMALYHHVPASRLRADYCRRWWYGKGVSRARMEAIHPVTESGLDLRHVPMLAGIPRFLFGTAARDAARWVAAVLRGDTGGRIAAETQLWYFRGQIRERLRHGLRPQTQHRRACC
jgi:glycosyltransferase involved in cell wall biosynthesis